MIRFCITGAVYGKDDVMESVMFGNDYSICVQSALVPPSKSDLFVALVQQIYQIIASHIADEDLHCEILNDKIFPCIKSVSNDVIKGNGVEPMKDGNVVTSLPAKVV